MINNKIKCIIALIALSVTFGSCRKFLKQELNNDPTALEYPDPVVMLPTAIANLAYYYGGDLTRYDALITQQVNGGGNQWISLENYNFVDADFDNVWNGLYVTTLNNLARTGEYCKEKNYVHYLGITKILSAFTYATLVDHFNDIPYTEALQGIELLQPKFDDASGIYTSLHTQLNEGIALLDEVNEGRAPSNDDLLFGGDTDSWKAFAHAIKARMYMHTKNYTEAKAELGMAGGIDAKMVFTSPSSGPMYQFDDNRFGDIEYMGSYIYNEMTTIGDSRIYNYVDTAFNSLGATYYRADQPVFLISAMEQKFMEAEILARAGDASAAASLESAVAMSYDFVNGDTTGMAASLATYPYNDADPLSDRLKAVMMQKYFAMFLQPESFADYRRTGYPELTATSGPSVPRRFLYPTDEKNTNPNTPSGVTLFLPRVFWDN
ncbi:MAG: SusD/RagB family nutrient-binding outer membrane lipoprotein [Chitinophagaceae bacterium]